MKLTAVLSLQDNYTPALKKAINETIRFRSELGKTKKALDDTFKKKYHLNFDTGKAQVALSKINQSVTVMKRNILNIRNPSINFNFKMNIGTVLAMYKMLFSQGKKMEASPFKVVLKAVDLVTAPFRMMKSAAVSAVGAIKNAATSMAGALQGAFTKAFDVTKGLVTESIKGASALEDTSLVVEHFIKINNKGMTGDKVKQQTAQYMDDFRKKPELAAFNTNEVTEAGTKAIAITNGDTNEATNLLRLSADMAALTPGKSLLDAMKALGDLRKGEGDAMKDFNFEVDSASIKSAGHDLGKVKNKKGIALGNMYKGAAEEKGQTAGGLMTGVKNSFKNNLADMGKGTLEVLKPELQKLSSFLNGDAARKMFNSGAKMMAGLTKSVFSGIRVVYGWLTSDATRKMLNSGIKMISSFAKPIFSGILAVQKWISGSFLKNMNFDGLSDLKDKLLNGMSSLKAAFDGWYENGGKDMIVSYFKNMLVNGVEFLVKAIPMVLDFGLKIGLAIVEGIGTGLMKLGSMGWNWIKGLFGKDDDKKDKSKDPDKQSSGIASYSNNSNSGFSNQNALLAPNPTVSVVNIQNSNSFKLDSSQMQSTGATAQMNTNVLPFKQPLSSNAPSNGAASIMLTQKEQPLKKQAIGLTRVPYDNYPALLHENERVLTAQEARTMNNNSSVTINLSASKQVDPDINRLMAALKSAVESAGFNMAPGGVPA